VEKITKQSGKKTSDFLGVKPEKWVGKISQKKTTNSIKKNTKNPSQNYRLDQWSEPMVSTLG